MIPIRRSGLGHELLVQCECGHRFWVRATLFEVGCIKCDAPRVSIRAMLKKLHRDNDWMDNEETWDESEPVPDGV